MSNDYFENKKKYCSYSCAAKCRVVSQETRLKKSLISKRLGLKPPTWDELNPEQQMNCREKRKNIPSPMLGKKHTEESKKKMGVRLDKNSHWKGGITFSKNYKRMKKMEYLGRKWNAKGSHTIFDWEELKKKYNYMCLCCKRFEPEIKLTEDHIIPLSKGGNDTIKNIQPLCGPCNSRKMTREINYISEYFDINIVGVKK